MLPRLHDVFSAMLFQRELPSAARLHVVVPLTVFAVACLGLTFPLPPGPLCDEGMVLFMEGGCDWGLSNVFFYSKVGLLLVLNLCFLASAAGSPRASPWRGFVPHLLMLGLLAVGTTDSDCDTYYGHPNGNVAQMVLEGTTFALLGISLLDLTRGRPRWVVVGLALAWNAFHVAVFYAWLLVTDHWTWLHTLLMCCTFLLAAAGLRLGALVAGPTGGGGPSEPAGQPQEPGIGEGAMRAVHAGALRAAKATRGQKPRGAMSVG